ncbi:uncharacterized protein YjiS (DUF1127 family) [Phyllobacterium trifolii]|jgi:uncharacterized protein YjiS (DUF1127 family)|uniref:Uncharacterized protein YjiS (DUF1127 family) n=1 Tax=Phyllobacterium trifolii TaxID=300193 RepID=A0A839UJG4_9HYPH|nr:DUF1127 domain-containing protein [Phyllobacterium trifolii]MBB3148741.1 uncharacterized protein YjiS (DUF1127 family) [Phyllobacterium trifolii]
MGPIYIDPGRFGLVPAFQYDLLTRAVRWLENAAVKRRTRLELGSLGDDGLKDLGLTRDHVEADLERYYS